MEKGNILSRIKQCGIVPVLRGKDTDKVLKAVQATLAGGVDIIEITFTVPGAVDIIKELSSKMKHTAVVGAGTVLSTKNAEDAIKAGAEFIVSPNVDTDVIETAKKYNKPCMPGAFSPTEVHSAWEKGADIIKVFPASVLGPGYLKALKGPFPDIQLMPTGGVDLENAGKFLEAGAVCLAVGGKLIDKAAMEEGNFEVITENAKKFRAIVKQYL